MSKNLQRFLFTICIFLTFVFFNIPYTEIGDFENGMMITSDEISTFNNNYSLGRMVGLAYDSNAIYADDMNDTRLLQVKLFNLFTIKSVYANVVNTEVVVGGNAIGMLLNCDGVIIVGFNYVMTKEGNKYPFEKSIFKVGDRITSVNGAKVYNSDDIDNALNSQENNDIPVLVEGFRGSEYIKQEITPIKDYISNRFKFGLWIRDNASGVGTLTYIRTDNNRFGALGHPISEAGQNEPLKIEGGEIYNCDVVGINKGIKGKPGDIRGLFVINDSYKQGEIDKNISFGVFGKIDEGSDLIDTNKLEIGGRLSIKPGKASIMCSLDGRSVQEYEIEIIKTNFQRTSNSKSMVIRVTDKKLIEKTGGIIQGMSGSPIVQNGKLIGAVTHVFSSDPTKGFGIYLDWMIEE